ncbi:histidinol-phosphatase HisJ [Clostridium sp. YIM B02505]|uniref:Histidinol-phosphatase n=1 Tax=Clostridium yunnanense TaxID=2800325 RepID=A0ABS1EME5_9CLOT|nr:histidinol-phosphatase HisJ [Clostridium yunnanense]MBK1810529.1 histidinol-phosphatase HisJ [Clostridium yunnanense]
MDLFNYHMHNYYCDGKGEPEDYVKRAIELGFKAIGFSSHAPVDIPNEWTMRQEDLSKYVEEIIGLKEKYKGKIEIYLGLEIDYIKDFMGPGDEIYKNIPLDYCIGSVHFMPIKDTGEYLTVDYTEAELRNIIEKGYDGDSYKFVEAYYGFIREMAATSKPDIVGHLDLIKKFNKNNLFFREDDSRYVEQIEKTLKVIKENDLIVEVNTGGVTRGYISEYYPSEWIIKRCKELSIPMSINSDAHVVDNLAGCFKEAAEQLKNNGINEQKILLESKWVYSKL